MNQRNNTSPGHLHGGVLSLRSHHEKVTFEHEEGDVLRAVASEVTEEPGPKRPGSSTG